MGRRLRLAALGAALMVSGCSDPSRQFWFSRYHSDPSPGFRCDMARTLARYYPKDAERLLMTDREPHPELAKMLAARYTRERKWDKLEEFVSHINQRDDFVKRKRELAGAIDGVLAVVMEMSIPPDVLKRVGSYYYDEQRFVVAYAYLGLHYLEGTSNATWAGLIAAVGDENTDAKLRGACWALIRWISESPNNLSFHRSRVVEPIFDGGRVQDLLNYPLEGVRKDAARALAAYYERREMRNELNDLLVHGGAAQEGALAHLKYRLRETEYYLLADPAKAAVESIIADPKASEYSRRTAAEVLFLHYARLPRYSLIESDPEIRKLQTHSDPAVREGAAEGVRWYHGLF